jgi:hypothetical protein
MLCQAGISLLTRASCLLLLLLVLLLLLQGC